MPDPDVSTSRVRYSAPKGDVDADLATPTGQSPAAENA